MTIDGSGKTITWKDPYNGTLFEVANGASLTLKDVTIDGGNEYTFYNDTTTVADGQNWYTRFVDVGMEDKAINADVIVNAGNLTLGGGTVIQNVTIAYNGENGKTENTPAGGYILKYNESLAVIKSNGGEVSLSGAKINGNAGVILNARNAKSTMNGATIEGNMGCGREGGIIIANGGTMTIDKNTSLSSNKAMARSATVLGVINGAKVTFSGTMNGNKQIGVGSNTAGAIVVLEGASQFVMDGGSISNNVGGRAGAIASRWVDDTHSDTSIILDSGTISGNTATNDSWNGASIFLRSSAEINEGMLIDGIIEVNQAPAELHITGGTLNGSLIVDDTNLPVEITGGTFSEKPADDLIGAGYIALPSDSGSGYTIVELKNSASIHVAPASLDFGSKEYGYASVDTQELTVTNDGSVTVKVAMPTDASYEFDAGNVSCELESGESVTFSVRPIIGLGVGLHKVDVKIRADYEGVDPTNSSTVPAYIESAPVTLLFEVKAISVPNVTPKPSGGGYSGPDVWYIGGNTFGTSTNQVPTSVEIDQVPVSFTMNGSQIVVGCVDPNANWVKVSWGSTTNTVFFTPDASVVCTQVGIPKTGDMSFWAAVAAFFGF